MHKTRFVVRIAKRKNTEYFGVFKSVFEHWFFGINNRDFVDYYHRNSSDSKLAVHLHLMNHFHACS